MKEFWKGEISEYMWIGISERIPGTIDAGNLEGISEAIHVRLFLRVFFFK